MVALLILNTYVDCVCRMHKSLTVLVVDDEPLAAERLANLVVEVSNCTVLAKANNAEQARALVHNQQPDVLLLDIAMPGLSGLAFAKELQTLKQPPFIVFCTAYNQHALQAFDAQAIDYLVKPVRRERLRESLERVQRLKYPQRMDVPNVCVTTSVGGVLRPIALDTIFYLHAEEKYTMVYHRGGEHILDEPLKELEQRFPGQFLRIHRNCLVKIGQLLEIRRDNDGQAWAILKEWPKALEISRRCASELKDRFKYS
jgi:two-component system response regulator AlgR